MKVFNVMWIIIVGLLFNACISPQEKQARQDNAFDVSGTYVTTKSSDIPMSINISNQTSRYDILVNIAREGKLTDKEISFYKEFGLPLDKITSDFANNITLGEGFEFELDGGENISDDFGATSKIQVYSSERQYKDGLFVSYTLYATMTKASTSLKGRLVAEIRKLTYEKVDGKDTQTQEFKSIDLYFETDPHATFSKQYMGTWAGEASLEENVNFDTKAISTITLTDNGDATFKVASAQNKLKMADGTYSFSSTNYSMSELNDKSPVIELRFTKDATHEIILWGVIESLGDMTGVIVLINGTNEKEIGTFDFKKN